MSAMEPDLTPPRQLHLPQDLIGRASFTEALHLRLTGSLPAEGVGRMLDACLVIFLDHGLTPSALAARLTNHGAPENLQGAVAAGILGAGSRYLGTSGDVAALLADAREQADGATPTPAAVARLAFERHAKVPGFGHPIYGRGDPRATALLELQRELGLPHENADLMSAVETVLLEQYGADLRLNAAGAIGAVICDLGLPPDCGRGLAIIARCGGLLAHVLEERSQPISSDVWAEMRQRFPKAGWSGSLVDVGADGAVDDE